MCHLFELEALARDRIADLNAYMAESAEFLAAPSGSTNPAVSRVLGRTRRAVGRGLIAAGEALAGAEAGAARRRSAARPSASNP